MDDVHYVSDGTFGAINGAVLFSNVHISFEWRGSVKMRIEHQSSFCFVLRERRII